MVECDLAKVEVAGSNPVSRSNLSELPSGSFSKAISALRGWTIFKRGTNLSTKARYPSGKGEVCKTFMRRFDSDPRLQILSK